MKRIFLLILLFFFLGNLYSQCNLKNGEYIVFKENNLWGIKDSKNDHIIISPRYFDLFCYNDSLLLVFNKNDVGLKKQLIAL